MKWKIRFSRTASKDFSELDELYKTQLTEEINSLEKLGNKHPKIKSLTGPLKGYFRIRQGDYRIIFTYQEKTIFIASILHRQEAYKKK